METYRNVPYESCSVVDRRHHRITQLAMLVEWTARKASVYLTFLPGVHSTVRVDRGPGEGTSHSFILPTIYQLGRSFLQWC